MPSPPHAAALPHLLCLFHLRFPSTAAASSSLALTLTLTQDAGEPAAFTTLAAAREEALRRACGGFVVFKGKVRGRGTEPFSSFSGGGATAATSLLAPSLPPLAPWPGPGLLKGSPVAASFFIIIFALLSRCTFGPSRPASSSVQRPRPRVRAPRSPHPDEKSRPCHRPCPPAHPPLFSRRRRRRRPLSLFLFPLSLSLVRAGERGHSRAAL